MTKIDFYILQEESLAARDHFACRLAEKALSRGHHVVVAVNDKAHGESLSDYLWSFKPESFIPHTLANTENYQASTHSHIVIDWQEPDTAYHDVLINLSHQIPTTFSRFQRFSEIVIQDPELLTLTRSHFQFYRDRGYPLKSHKIST